MGESRAEGSLFFICCGIYSFLPLSCLLFVVVVVISNNYFFLPRSTNDELDTKVIVHLKCQGFEEEENVILGNRATTRSTCSSLEAYGSNLVYLYGNQERD